MNQRGSISFLITSKMGIAIAVILLIISMNAFSSRIGRETEKEKLDSVIRKITTILHKAEYLPGRVKIEEELPSVDSPYKLELSGSRKDDQIVNIKILSSKELEKTLILNITAEKENFKIRAENPRKIILRKFEKFSIEVF